MTAVDGRIPEADRTIGEATIRAIDELGAADLLAAITPERIGRLTGYSASSIRYRLNARSPAALPGELLPAKGVRRWGFDREQLFGGAVEVYAERLLAVARAAADRYVAALERLGETGDLAALEAAIDADLGAYAVGGAEDGAGEMERLSLLALAACDGSTLISRRLREAHEGRRAQLEAVYTTALRITGRVLLPGRTLTELADEISNHLEGVSLRRRYEPTYATDALARSIIALFMAHTAPAEGPANDPVAEFLRAAGPSG